jgi:hypothetical protein
VGTTAAFTGLAGTVAGFFAAAAFCVAGLAAPFFVFDTAAFFVFGAAGAIFPVGTAAGFCAEGAALPALAGCAATPFLAAVAAAPVLAGAAGVPVLEAAFAGADVPVAGACVLVAGVADFVDAGFALTAGVTAPVFTPGAVFVVAEAFLAGAVLVADDGLAFVPDVADDWPLALAGLAVLAGDGVAVGLAFACEAPLSVCPMAAVTSIVAIARILISFIVVSFTCSARSTSPPARLLEAALAWPVSAAPDRPRD